MRDTTSRVFQGRSRPNSSRHTLTRGVQRPALADVMPA